MRKRNRTAVWGFLAAALAVSFVLSAWPGAAIGGESNGIHVAEAGTRQGDTNTTIYVGSYKFDCMIGEPELPPELIAPEPESGVIGLYIIHCISQILPEWEDALNAINIEILYHLKHNALCVIMTPEQASLAENLSFVDWVGLYHPAYKISSTLDNLEVVVVLHGREIPDSVIQQLRTEFSSVKSEGFSETGLFGLKSYVFVGTLPSKTALHDMAANPNVTSIYEKVPILPLDDSNYALYLLIIIIIIVCIVSTIIVLRRKRKHAPTELPRPEIEKEERL